ncbi:MAG: hypothetical protein U9Q82_07165 [Chloroflexota bacterium]|nr:hypothetical protein [Chloroflexota bacterium]
MKLTLSISRLGKNDPQRSYELLAVEKMAEASCLTIIGTEGTVAKHAFIEIMCYTLCDANNHKELST